jgi:hypothetical protein
MSGGLHKPFQLPCPGTVICGTGPKYAQKKSGEGPVAAFHETTLVNGIAPTGLAAVLVCNTASGHPVAYDGTNNGASPSPHGPWVNGAAPVPPVNTFAQAGTVDLSLCRKRGFKSVQAKRYWHGTPPWTCGLGASEGQLPSSAWPGSAGPAFAPFRSAVNDTKYTTVTYDVHFDWQQNNEAVSHSTSTASGSISVDPLTGVLTTSLTTSQDAYYDSGFSYTGQIYHASGGAGWTYSVAGGHTDYTHGMATDVDGMLADLHVGNLPIVQGTGGFIFEGALTPQGLMDAITQWNFVAAGVGGTILPQMTDFNNYSASGAILFDGVGFPGLGGQPYKSIVISFSRTGSVVSWDVTQTTNIAVYDAGLGTNVLDPNPVYCHAYGSMTLSGSNPGSAVYADLLALKDLWDLNDDILYPWRTDGNVGIAPLVSRNEVPTHVSPVTGQFHINSDGSTWVDGNAALYDGSILGAPKPAGYGYNADGSKQGIFDFRHEVDDWCFPDDYPDSPAYFDTFNYGARTPDFLPQNCPQWTEDINAPNFPAGKFLLFNGKIDIGWTPLSVDVLFVQDWIQTEENWPSYDFARPAGADRFTFDETTPAGIDKVFPYLSGYSAGTGDTITVGNAPILVVDLNGNSPGSSFDDPGQLPLEDGVHHPVDYIETFGPGGSPTLPTISSGDVWGGQCVGGFYHVTRLSDSTVLLGAKVFNLPTGWTCPSSDETLAFGRLRFPACPGILGRVAISAVTNASPCHLTLDSSPYLAMDITASPPSSELVDLCAADMTVLASNVAVTRVSDTDFTVPNSGSTAYATIAAAKFVIVHGAPAYYWDDTMPKGNLLALEFTFNYRMKAETQRINDLITACGDPTDHPEFTDCDCSPLGSAQTVPFSVYSDFTQTQLCVPWTQCGPRVAPVADFPGSFPMDSQYGSRWQACVVSAIQDLLWQKPHVPPSFVDSVSEDVVTTFAWLEDDGTCQISTETPPVNYYAHAPMVEAFTYMPVAGMSGTEAAPAVPAGITVGFTSPVTNGDSETLYAPGPGGWTPWGLHQNLCGCVGSGRFGGDYAVFTLDC